MHICPEARLRDHDIKGVCALQGRAFISCCRPAGVNLLKRFVPTCSGQQVNAGVSTYNVTPQQAGFYFNKIQCFCFEEQKLRPGEKIDMPVFFYVDPEFAMDPRLKGIDQLTLSYTFFKVSEEDDSDAEGEEQ